MKKIYSWLRANSTSWDKQSKEIIVEEILTLKRSWTDGIWFISKFKGIAYKVWGDCRQPWYKSQISLFSWFSSQILKSRSISDLESTLKSHGIHLIYCLRKPKLNKFPPMNTLKFWMTALKKRVLNLPECQWKWEWDCGHHAGGRTTILTPSSPLSKEVMYFILWG